MLDVLLHVIIVIFQLESYWWSWYGTLKHLTSKINDRFSRLHYVNLCKRLHWRMKCVTWLNSAITSKETQRRATIAREKKKLTNCSWNDILATKYILTVFVLLHYLLTIQLPSSMLCLLSFFFYAQNELSHLWISQITWHGCTHTSRTYKRFV